MATPSVTKPSPEVVAEQSLDSNLLNLCKFAGMSLAQTKNLAKALDMPEAPDEFAKVHPQVLAVCTEADFTVAISEMEGGFFGKNLAKRVHALAVALTTVVASTPSGRTPR